MRLRLTQILHAAGADSRATVGEEHDPEPHLIPCIYRRRPSGGRRAPGFSHGLPHGADGTCVRDYIHIIATRQGPLLALERLESG